MASQDFQADWISGHDGADKLSSATASGKGKSTGSWQAIGVSSTLARALTLRGFKTPTPIQRAAIPSALSNPPRDVLGMARTGSGKTLAYMVPLLHRLGGVRKEGSGIRALIMCPGRELAVQVLKVGKDLARSLATGGNALRWAIVMGGESLDAQFESMSSSPDIVIATPGRFLHLVVEMELDLRTIDTIVYDEADRLFEMGFEQQLREIVHRLPASRHSLLFSATLPTSLAEFAKAGLSHPQFIRLDTEHRINPDLNVAFFSVKPDEKDAALIVLLREVIRVPVESELSSNSPQAIIFVSTKHHVEYLSTLLRAAGYRASFIYGSLDQIARQQQLRSFRDGQSDLLVVTDVAARGLDIPAMGHVVNYDFPSGVRVFVHRVGRTARAGQQGHAWTLVTRDDVPYLRDLEIFLERPLLSDAGLFGAIPRESLEPSMEFINQSLEMSEPQLPSLREVMKRGQSMFERSRSKASKEAYKAVKPLQSQLFNTQASVHPVFNRSDDNDDSTARRHELLASLHSYNPTETIFEIGSRGQQTTNVLMKQRRQTIAQHNARTKRKIEMEAEAESEDEEDVKSNVAASRPTSARHSYRDPNFFLPHENVETNRDKGYSLTDGASFAEQARSATLDLNGDEGEAQRAQKASQLKWDRKKKRFVKGDGTGSNNEKMIRSESGALLPATFKSGRFAEWRQRSRGGPKADSNGRPPDGRGSKRGAGQELATAESILKGRQEKLKRKQKNGRVPRKRT